MKRIPYIIATFVALCCCLSAVAQRATIGFIYPAGGAQGSSVDIEIGGMNLADATGVIISGDGVRGEIIPLVPRDEVDPSLPKSKGKKRVKVADQNAPQLASRIGVRIHIDPTAEIGLRDLRLRSSKGVSSKLSFEVSPYPNFEEKRYATKESPNVVDKLPVTLCGQVMPGQIDYYTFEANRGDLIVAEVKGRTLIPYIADAVPGWFQPVVTIRNSRGEEVAYGDDYLSSPDPVVRMAVKESDTYTLTIHDAIYRGRADFTYRIHLGRIPFVENIAPAVAQVGGKSKIAMEGHNLAKGEVKISPKKEGINYLRGVGRSGGVSNAVPYWVAKRDERVMMMPKEGSDFGAKSVIYDTIRAPYCPNRYSLMMAAGESVILDVKARCIESQGDLRMRIVDSAGTVVASSDDAEDSTQGLVTHHADPTVNFVAKSAGRYTIEIDEVMGLSGAYCDFILVRGEARAPFDAFVSPANITIPQGGTNIFAISIKRKEGVKSLIGGLSIDGLPEGFATSSLEVQPYARSVEVSITAPKGAALGTMPVDVKLTTKPKAGEAPIETLARPADDMTQAFYYVHHIASEAFEVEVVPALPYTIHFDKDIESNPTKPIMFNRADSVLRFKMHLEREAGFDDEVELFLTKKSPFMVLSPAKFLTGESEIEVELKVNTERLAKQKYFRYLLAIDATVNGEIVKMGKREFQNAKYRAMTPFVTIQMRVAPPDGANKTAAASK